MLLRSFRGKSSVTYTISIFKNDICIKKKPAFQGTCKLQKHTACKDVDMLHVILFKKKARKSLNEVFEEEATQSVQGTEKEV